MRLIRWFLFETKLGERVMSAFERWTGLALVQVDQVAETRVGIAA